MSALTEIGRGFVQGFTAPFKYAKKQVDKLKGKKKGKGKGRRGMAPKNGKKKTLPIKKKRK